MKNLIKKLTPFFVLDFYHYLLALIGVFFYGFPSHLRQGFGGQARKLIVIGVTGTKGKSTTVILAGKILEEAGFKVGWISSATLKVGEKEWLNPFHMTMPGRFAIQKLIREIVDQKCRYCLIEVTSEGILQHRHKFINFNTAVFTNLKPEHIEAHGSFENYRAAKGKLFQTTKKIHILNLNDENIEYFLKFPAEKKIGFTTHGELFSVGCGEQFSVIEAKNIQLLPSGIKFSVNNIEFNLNLLGEFNIYNALAAISIGLSQGVNLITCKTALEKIRGIVGRMEVVIEKPFTIIVDLAHTPDSFEEAFKTIKNLPHNKIIAVFGSAGGGRDKWKRPILGEIAAKYCDEIIITNEDCYNEDPMEIIEQINNGAERGKSKIYKVLDRREAIRKSLELARPNDIVAIMGKGTEQSIYIAGNKKLPWDDREVVKEEFGKLTLR